jgi:hypothetical protein
MSQNPAFPLYQFVDHFHLPDALTRDARRQQLEIGG